MLAQKTSVPTFKRRWPEPKFSTNAQTCRSATRNWLPDSPLFLAQESTTANLRPGTCHMTAKRAPMPGNRFSQFPEVASDGSKSSSRQPVELHRVVVQKLALLGDGAIGDDLFEGRHPLLIAG